MNPYSEGYGNNWQELQKNYQRNNLSARDELSERLLAEGQAREIESARQRQQMENAAANNWAERVLGKYSLANTDGEEPAYYYDSNPMQYMIGPQESNWRPEHTASTQREKEDNERLEWGTRMYNELYGSNNIPTQPVEAEEDDEPETATDAVNSAVAAGAEEKKVELQQAQQVAQQQAAMNAMQQLQQAIGNNMLSSDDVYNRDYQRYRSMGYSDRKARKWAAENAGNYRLQRISGLNDAFTNYGINQDGSINNIGASIIGMMGREDGQQAMLMQNGRPTLAQVWEQAQKQMAAEDAFQRQIYLHQLDFANRQALQEARLAARGVGGGGGSSGSSGGSGGGRGSSTSKEETARDKFLDKIIKEKQQLYKDDPDAASEDVDYQQALSERDSRNRAKMYAYQEDWDEDNYEDAVSMITAALDGRNAEGRQYDKGTLKAWVNKTFQDDKTRNDLIEMIDRY